MNQHKPPGPEEKALADCLASLETGEATVQDTLARYPDHQRELGELLSLAQTLSALGELSPRREFIEDAKRELIASLPDRPEGFRSWIGRLRQIRLPVLQLRSATVAGALVLLVVFFLMTHTVLHAASVAGPGDLLYGLNLTVESVKLKLASDAVATTTLHLDLAKKRLTEAQEALDKGSVGHVLMALEGYEKQYTSINALIERALEPEKEKLTDMLLEARSAHLETLMSLLADVPEEAKAAVQHAIDVSAAVVNLPVGWPAVPPFAVPDAGKQPEEAAAPEKPPITLDEALPAEDPTSSDDPPGAPVAVPTTEPELPLDPPVTPDEHVPPVKPDLPIDLPVPPADEDSRDEPPLPIDLPAPPVDSASPTDIGPPVVLPVPPNEELSPVEPTPAPNLPEPPAKPPLPRGGR
jgi:hypothetical protein